MRRATGNVPLIGVATPSSNNMSQGRCRAFGIPSGNTVLGGSCALSGARLTKCMPKGGGVTREPTGVVMGRIANTNSASVSKFLRITKGETSIIVTGPGNVAMGKNKFVGANGTFLAAKGPICSKRSRLRHFSVAKKSVLVRKGKLGKGRTKDLTVLSHTIGVGTNV